MSRRSFVARAGLAALGALAVTIALAQIPAQAPILNFRLPIFNPAGFRAWELRGATGRYVDRDRVELTGVRLQVLSGDEAGTVELEVASPEAIAQPESRMVSGPGQLHVTGRGFELFGNDWTYEDATKTLIIRRDVVTAFKQNIGDILR
jgi:hypothetical protein